MARPEVKGLKYFPFDTGFFRDKKIRLLRGEHNAAGIEVYQRIVCKCYEDENGYFLKWDSDMDCALMAEETGYSIDKIRLIVSTCLKWSLFDNTLFMAGNVLTSRGIQRRYFSAIKDTRKAAASKGRYTTIDEGLCLLTESDFSELNKTQAWLKVAQKDSNSPINSGNSPINSGNSPINPVNEMKGNERKVNKRVSECPASPPAAPAQQQNTYGEFGKVRITEIQRQTLVDRFGEAMATDYINRLDQHMASTGKPFPSHYATIRKWIDQDMRKEKAEKEKTSAPPKQKPNRFANFKQREWDFEEIEKNERRWLESQLKSNGG